MSDPGQAVETVDTVAKVGGGGIIGSMLMVFIARFFKSSDLIALLMSQRAADTVVIQRLLTDVSALQVEHKKLEERANRALSDQRARLDKAEGDMVKVRMELGLVEKTHEISELKAELDATKKE